MYALICHSMQVGYFVSLPSAVGPVLWSFWNILLGLGSNAEEMWQSHEGSVVTGGFSSLVGVFVCI